MDQPFTYLLPETLRHRVQTGCRVLVPFGTRKLTGVVLRTHDDPPAATAREALRLLDEEPALDADLLKLGRWIASYYCAPLGETLRAMTPLSGDLRRGKIYSLTSSGRDAARQLYFGENDEDPATEILRMLDARQLSATYLVKKVDGAARILKSLEKKGFIECEDVAADRDPLRASAARLRGWNSRRGPKKKLPKSERELALLISNCIRERTTSNEIEKVIARASRAARGLAKLELVNLTLAAVGATSIATRGPHALNPHQQEAYGQIETAIASKQFHTFLLQGVTGSGKTEIYLKAIEATLAAGRGALLLVPEIGLTPAVAGQFHQRFGERVAILHSAFNDSERAQEWRRIRGGEAGVVVATRAASGVFAPVRNLGLDRGRRRA